MCFNPHDPFYSASFPCGELYPLKLPLNIGLVCLLPQKCPDSEPLNSCGVSTNSVSFVQLQLRPHCKETSQFLRMVQETIPSKETELRRQANGALAALKPRSLPLMEVLGNDSPEKTLDWTFGRSGWQPCLFFGGCVCVR